MIRKKFSSSFLADPYGAKTKTFSRSAFNDKYKLLGRQAVVVE